MERDKALAGTVLWHQHNARSNGILRPWNSDRPSFDADLAAPCRLNASEHPRQRRAPAAQQTRHTDHLAAMQRQVDVDRLGLARQTTRLE